MCRLLIYTVLLLNIALLSAQIENPNRELNLEPVEDEFKAPIGIEFPALKKPNLSNFESPLDSNTILEPIDDTEKVDFTKGDGLLDYTSNRVPRAFKKDKEATEEYGRDQDLGDVITNGSFVQVKYRDHEYVDGDRIRVFVNDDMVQSDLTLTGSFKGFTLTLVQGFNRIEFEAINQGSSGPNTAELHVYNDKGQLISAAEWNLLTGNVATIIVIKE